ncbi:MAG TPA: hypothetical protein VFK39_11530 [Gemmatimonadaceae bacterium]|nr:hypothetical protein [Gemmatimonadaceae bacterium]
MRKLLYVGALALVAGACSSDELSPVGPDAQNCTVGSMKVGDTKTGDIGASSCSMYDWYWWEDSVHFESYNVTVEKGKGYLFSVDGDAAASRSLGLASASVLVGDSASLYMAVQDPDNWEDGAPGQIFFVAPKTGTYSLRVFSRNLDDQFDYTLTARECKPRVIDIQGAYANDTASLNEDDCTIEEPYFSWVYANSEWTRTPSHVALYTIHYDGSSRRRITVQSDDFAPGMMLAGPGFDAWCDTYYSDCDNTSNSALADSISTTWDMWVPGVYTLAVGSMQPNATGKFKISISEPLSDDVATLRMPKDWGELLPGQWKKMSAPR